MLSDTQQSIINYLQLWAPSESSPLTSFEPDRYWFRKTREQCRRELGAPYDFDASWSRLQSEKVLIEREKQTRSGLINIYFEVDLSSV
jgi:hypothetical protein